MDCVDAGNVLVHLFLQTKTQYALSNKKLQYLLIIAQMARLSQGSLLFDDDIRNFRQSFVLDAIGNNFVSDSDIVSGTCSDKPICCEVSHFAVPYTKKKIYEIAQTPSDDDRNLLISVFLRFGGYREITLCKFLCDFKPLRNVPAFTTVSKEKISSFLFAASYGNQYSKNPIFDFVKKQYSEVKKADKTLDNSDFYPEAALPEVAPEPAREAYGDPVTSLDKVPAARIGQPKAILKGVSSLQNIVVGKEYSVLVELTTPTKDCQLSILALSTNKELDVVRKRLSDTLYRFTFVSIASDIRISAHIVG